MFEPSYVWADDPIVSKYPLFFLSSYVIFILALLLLLLWLWLQYNSLT